MLNCKLYFVPHKHVRFCFVQALDKGMKWKGKQCEYFDFDRIEEKGGQGHSGDVGKWEGQIGCVGCGGDSSFGVPTLAFLWV